MNQERYTEADAIAALNALDGQDFEAAHATADQILLNFLWQEGYTALTLAYREADRRVGFQCA